MAQEYLVYTSGIAIRMAGRMRCNHYVVQSPKRRLFLQGFMLENVEVSSGQPSLLQGLNQVAFHNHLSSRHVYKAGPRLSRPKRALINHTARPIGQRGVGREWGRGKWCQ